jgi:hypothetical protein
MPWVEHRDVGYEAPVALTLSFTTQRWGIGLSIKQKRKPLRWQCRVLLGKWHWCLTFG